MNKSLKKILVIMFIIWIFLAFSVSKATDIEAPNELLVSSDVETTSIEGSISDQYAYIDLMKKGDLVTETVVKNGTAETKKLLVLCDRDISVYAEVENSSTILPEIKLNDKIFAPISKGDVVGTLKYEVLDQTYEANLIAASDVEPDTLSVKIFCIVLVVLVFTLLVILALPNGDE